jgi:pyruvate dehydrogenase E1 component alpha subunit
VIWNLPVVFVCENNLYMEYTPISAVTAVQNPAADRALAYGLEPILIDGNDIDIVYETATAALDRARHGEGPSLIEAQTYRHGGHSRADPGKYRPEDELKAWLEKDPLPNYRARLLALGIDAAAIEAIETETEAAVDAATEAARNSPPPPVEIAHIDVWADGSSAWRN